MLGLRNGLQTWEQQAPMAACSPVWAVCQFLGLLIDIGCW